jgi:DNA-binding response OmpR family regulator
VENRLALIIEDNTDLAALFSMALETAGFEAEIIETGDSAMTRLEDMEQPGVVILDLCLPNVNGADILRYIRSTDRLARTPVIIATADARAAELLENLADLVLVKPISIAQLRDLALRIGQDPSLIQRED